MYVLHWQNRNPPYFDKQYLTNLASKMQNPKAVLFNSPYYLDLIVADQSIYHVEKDLQKRALSATSHLQESKSIKKTCIEHYAIEPVRRWYPPDPIKISVTIFRLHPFGIKSLYICVISLWTIVYKNNRISLVHLTNLFTLLTIQALLQNKVFTRSSKYANKLDLILFALHKPEVGIYSVVSFLFF